MSTIRSPMLRLAVSSGLILVILCVIRLIDAAEGRKVQPPAGNLQQNSDFLKQRELNVSAASPSNPDEEDMIEISAASSLLCYVDTSEFFAQGWAVPSEHQGTPMSCYSYDCADGQSCPTAFSHGWESTEQCEARRHNPAFKNVECCHGVGCNRPTDSSTWTYVGPSSTADGNLACYINDLPDCTTLYQPIPGCMDKALKAQSAYSVIYGNWSTNPSSTTGYACVRYQPLDLHSGKKLAGWTYTVINRASCALNGTSGKLGSSFSTIADISSSLCCTENDCNAPDASFDQMTVAGPTMATALGEQSTPAAGASSNIIEVGTLERYDEEIGSAGPQRLLSGMNAPAGDDAGNTFVRQPLSIPREYSDVDASPDLTQNMLAVDDYSGTGQVSNTIAMSMESPGVYGDGAEGSDAELESGQLQIGSATPHDSVEPTAATPSSRISSSTSASTDSGTATKASTATATNSTSPPAGTAAKSASIAAGAFWAMFATVMLASVTLLL